MMFPDALIKDGFNVAVDEDCSDFKIIPNEVYTN